MPLGASFSEDVPLVEFMFLVFTRTPGGVTISDSGLCCCVPCLLSTIISICLLILHKHPRPHSVSDYSFNFIQLPFLSICTSSASLLVEWRKKNSREKKTLVTKRFLENVLLLA